MRTIDLVRPDGGRFPIGAKFLDWSGWWGSHYDENNKWVKGQINGSGQHTGLDILTTTGTELTSPCDGEITFAGCYPSHPLYGNFVQVVKDGEPIYTAVNLCHMAAVSVTVGDTVKVGDRLGLSGATGHVEGPHVHVDVWGPGPLPIKWI